MRQSPEPAGVRHALLLPRQGERQTELWKQSITNNQNKGNHCGGGARPHFVSAFALARGPRPEVRRGAGAAEAGEQVGPAGGASVHFVH